MAKAAKDGSKKQFRGERKFGVFGKAGLIGAYADKEYAQKLTDYRRAMFGDGRLIELTTA